MLRFLTNTLRHLSHRTSKPARRPDRSRLGLEALESRDLLANYLLLDFTPDAVPGEAWQPSSFASAFDLRYDNGYAPGFLDFNQDGYVDSTDISLGAQAIANRVLQYFRGFDIEVWWGDAGNNTELGLQWLNWGLQSPSDQVFVMYTGGVRHDGNLGIFGEAFQPPDGYNNEYYAYTYATGMAAAYMSSRPGATPGQFIDDVARVVVHEFGHLVGLGHVYGNPAGDPNVMNYSADAAQAYIPDAWYRNIEHVGSNGQSYWDWQNPAQELAESLRGQANFANYFRGIYSRYEGSGHYQVTAEEILPKAHAGHEHGTAEGYLGSEYSSQTQLHHEEHSEPPLKDPGHEHLEDVVDHEGFIRQAFHDLLGRDADAAGLASLKNFLDNGGDRSELILRILHSEEHRRHDIQQMYRTYLRRDADSFGLTSYLAALTTGGTLEQVQAAIVGSDEFFQSQSGGTNEGFLESLYQDGLSRSIDATGRSLFTAALDRGENRRAVAEVVFGSPEYRARLVRGLYTRFHDREVDPEGLNYFAGTALAQGAGAEQVMAGIVGSPERFASRGRAR